MSDDKRINRRDFMSISIWAIGGLMGVVMAIPAVAYIVGPAVQRKKGEEWIRLGSTSKVVIGTPTLFKIKYQQQTGWVVNEEELTIYVLTENGRDYVALSNICTHLGCRVRWIDDQDVFLCPCHNALFAKNGLVISGPPPGPLEHFPVKVEDDQLYVLGG